MTIYLDNAASTPLRPGALEILQTSMKEDFANPSSAHRMGKELHRRIEACRERFLLEFLGAGKADRLIFTGSATESNNTVIMGLDFKAGDSAVVSKADHPSVTAPLERLEKQRNLRVKEMPMKDDGAPDEAALFQLLDETVRLVILTQVNNQGGVIIDVCRLSREIKALFPGIHIHVDAAQGFGKIPFCWKEGRIDSMSISSHKMGGPKGVAGLVLASGVGMSPLLVGGGQEGGLRSSTVAAPLIFAFCRAAAEAVENLESSLAYVSQLNRLAQEGLQEKIPVLRFPFISLAPRRGEPIKVCSASIPGSKPNLHLSPASDSHHSSSSIHHSLHSSPYILTFVLPGISSDIILRHLEQEGIMISSTSACSSKIKGVNPVFTALHLPPKEHKHVLRVSFSVDNTEAEVVKFCRTLVAIYDDLKKYAK